MLLPFTNNSQIYPEIFVILVFKRKKLNYAASLAMCSKFAEKVRNGVFLSKKYLNF